MSRNVKFIPIGTMLRLELNSNKSFDAAVQTPMPKNYKGIQIKNTYGFSLLSYLKQEQIAIFQHFINSLIKTNSSFFLRPYITKTSTKTNYSSRKFSPSETLHKK